MLTDNILLEDQTMKSAMYRTISLVIFLSVIIIIPAQGQETTTLEVGSSLERDIAASEKHIYIIDLDKSKFVYGELDQIGVDVVINVFNPEGERIGNFDEFFFEGQEKFHLETTDAGTDRGFLPMPHTVRSRLRRLLRWQAPCYIEGTS